MAISGDFTMKCVFSADVITPEEKKEVQTKVWKTWEIHRQEKEVIVITQGHAFSIRNEEDFGRWLCHYHEICDTERAKEKIVVVSLFLERRE